MTKLDIISDPICPWCYIGKSKLDRALEANPEHPFIVEWHPFQLNPTMPLGGMDRREYLEAKFGGKDGAIKVYGQIAQAAEDAGISIDFAAIKRTPNTLNAHRLIHWAGLEERQNAVVDRLFKAYFQLGLDISDHQVLIGIAQVSGMDAAVVERLLGTNEDSQDIQTRDANARERGVSGVPCFIVANEYAVSGAQSPEFWATVISDLKEASV